MIRDSFFYFVFEGNFQVEASRGLYSEGAILRYQFGGGGYIWRGLFSEFYTYVSKEYSECSNFCVEWA